MDVSVSKNFPGIKLTEGRMQPLPGPTFKQVLECWVIHSIKNPQTQAVYWTNKPKP